MLAAKLEHEYALISLKPWKHETGKMNLGTTHAVQTDGSLSKIASTYRKFTHSLKTVTYSKIAATYNKFSSHL
jgi:hypothetical protein